MCLWFLRRVLEFRFSSLRWREYAQEITMWGFVKQENNLVVRTWGTPRKEEDLLIHVDLVDRLDIVELEAGNKLLQFYVCWCE